MSGSRTDIIVQKTTPAEPSMDVDALNRTETPRKEDKNDTSTKLQRTSVPLSFKLKLIAEVKKHDIIWQDLKQKKNPDLVENAWQKIRKALIIKKEGFCEKQWKLLIHGYRSHLNRNTHLHVELIKDMAFVSSQLKKSSDEQSDSEAMELGSPTRNKAKTPKVKKETKHPITDDSNEDQKASVAILKLLFAQAPPDVMRPVRDSLVETLISLMPELDTKISEHAKQEIKKGGHVNNIDWSALDVPAEICKAVWDYNVLQVLLNT